MRPNYEPEYVEPQIHSIATSSTNNPPPLPPPATIAKATQSPPPQPPTHTIPGSLPAGSRVPKQGQRADIQQMSKSSSPSQGRLSAIVGRVGNVLSSWMKPHSQNQPVYPHPMTHPPHIPPRVPPAQQTHPIPIPIHTPPHTDVDMVHEEEREISSDLNPRNRSIPALPKSGEPFVWSHTPFQTIPI